MWPFTRRPGPVVAALIESLRHPDQWEVEKFNVIHTESGWAFWIANGAWALDGSDTARLGNPGVRSTPKMLTPRERRLLWPHVVEMIQNKVAMGLRTKTKT